MVTVNELRLRQIASELIQRIGAMFRRITDGVPATDITGVIPPANLGTGTPDAGKVLRGDGVWAAAVDPSALLTHPQVMARTMGS